MKNISKLLLTFSFALPFAACGGDDSGDEGAGTEATVTVTMTTADSGTGADDINPETGAEAPDTGAEAPDTGAEAPDTGADTGGGMACMHTCAADEDCFAAGGTDIGFICDASTCALANPCTDDASCVAQLSGWSFLPCTMGGGECMAAMQICVDLGDGSGGCATPPSEFIMCEALNQSEVMQTNLDDGSEVTVCGNTSGVCDTETGFCSSPCVDDTTCGTLVCNVDTGVCECDGDDDCGEGGTCTAGTCSVPGCMSDADCMNPFNGGTISCG